MRILFCPCSSFFDVFSSLPESFLEEMFKKKSFHSKQFGSKPRQLVIILFIQKFNVWGASQPLDRALGAEVDVQTDSEGVLDWRSM